jgi:hypothetical protein
VKKRALAPAVMGASPTAVFRSPTADQAAEAHTIRLYTFDSQRAGVLSQRAGILSQKAGVLSQKAGVLSQKAGVLFQKAGVLFQKAGVLSQKAGVRSKRPEFRSLRGKSGSPRADFGSPKTDFRSQRPKTGSWRTNFDAFYIKLYKKVYANLAATAASCFLSIISQPIQPPLCETPPFLYYFPLEKQLLIYYLFCFFYNKR